MYAPRTLTGATDWANDSSANYCGTTKLLTNRRRTYRIAPLFPCTAPQQEECGLAQRARGRVVCVIARAVSLLRDPSRGFTQIHRGIDASKSFTLAPAAGLRFLTHLKTFIVRLGPAA